MMDGQIHEEGFEINSYEIIEYIVKSIIDKLQEENIDLVDGRLGEKYEFSDFKKLELKKFKDLVNTSKKIIKIRIRN